VCPSRRLYHVSTARRISLSGEGNALYPVLSSIIVVTTCNLLVPEHCIVEKILRFCQYFDEVMKVRDLGTVHKLYNARGVGVGSVALYPLYWGGGGGWIMRYITSGSWFIMLILY